MERQLQGAPYPLLRHSPPESQRFAPRMKGPAVLLSDQAKAAYGAARPTTRTPRSTEYELFAQITSRLSASSPKNFANLADAVTENRKLWSRLAILVADPKNALPEMLRAQIFYLAEFTETHSRKVLSGEAEIDALIDINKSVMRGLCGQQAKAS